MLKNLKRQLRHSPRPAYLLYADFHVNDPGAEPSLRRYLKVLGSCAFLEKVSDSSYSLSPVDAAGEPSGCVANSFALYLANVMR